MSARNPYVLLVFARDRDHSRHPRPDSARARGSPSCSWGWPGRSPGPSRTCTSTCSSTTRSPTTRPRHRDDGRVSAIAATLAAVLVGVASATASAGAGVFIAVGYVLWGVSTMAFGLVNPENAGDPVASAVAVAVVAIVVLDCVMSFFGSGGQRRRVQRLGHRHHRRAQPRSGRRRARGHAAGVDAAGLRRPRRTDAGRAVVGVLRLVGGRHDRRRGAGVVPRARRAGEPSRTTGGSSRALVARPAPGTMARRTRGLYSRLRRWADLGISTQVFLPYLLIYIQYYLQIEAYALVLAVVLIGSPRSPACSAAGSSTGSARCGR